MSEIFNVINACPKRQYKRPDMPACVYCIIGLTGWKFRKNPRSWQLYFFFAFWIEAYYINYGPFNISSFSRTSFDLGKNRAIWKRPSRHFSIYSLNLTEVIIHFWEIVQVVNHIFAIKIAFKSRSQRSYPKCYYITAIKSFKKMA